jgi:predicted aldo/keto reductase-like oxidoreductase
MINENTILQNDLDNLLFRYALKEAELLQDIVDIQQELLNYIKIAKEIPQEQMNVSEMNIQGIQKKLIKLQQDSVDILGMFKAGKTNELRNAMNKFNDFLIELEKE